MAKWTLFAPASVLCGLLLLQPAALAQEAAPATTGENTAEKPKLAAEQQRLAKRFEELKQAMLKMSEVTASTDPRRAALLRKAYTQSTERAVDEKFIELVKLLEKEQLFQASKDQASLQQDLNRLLELLLSGDRDKQIGSERQRITAVLKEVNRLIRAQKAVQGQTQSDSEAAELSEQQAELAEKTKKLGQDLKAAEGKLGDDSEESSDEPNAPSPPEGEPKNSSQGEDAKPAGDQPSEQPEGDAKPDSDAEKEPAEKKATKPQKVDEPQKDKPEGDPSQSEQKPQDGSSSGEPKPGEQQPSSKMPAGSQRPMPGQPSEQQESPPSDEQQSEEMQEGQPSARKRIEAAEQRMRSAQKKLDEAKKKDAAQDQEKALQELEMAKAELERILRQLREEEIDRVLAMLESRFRKMLDMQTEVYEGTVRLAKVPDADRGREHEIEAGRLGRQESEIVLEADKALNLMKEEGSAVAFPEAVSQMREDMQQVAVRLGEANVGSITQGVEEDVIAALEDMLAALQKARKEQQEKKSMQSQSQGEPSDPPLVDKLSELKMIRALQMRVNTRTARYAGLLETAESEKPALEEALRRLSERQARIYTTTRDIVAGRNQ